MTVRGTGFIFLGSYKCDDEYKFQYMKLFTTQASLFPGGPKAPVVIRLEGSILVESQILGLFICQLCQVGIKGRQM